MTAAPTLQTHIAALIKRASAAALIGDGNSSFWRGYAKGLEDLLYGIGALAAAKDAAKLPESHPQAVLQAAGACLTKRAESIAITQVDQVLAPEGVEVAANPVGHAHIGAGEVLKHRVVAGINGDDKHSIARIDMRDGSNSHGCYPPSESAASLEHTDLPVLLAEGSIVLPAPQPLERGHWFENRFFRYAPDGSGLSYGRHHSDCCAPYWICREKRVDPLGARRWETGNIHYVPDDFGTLVEVMR